MSTPTSDAAHFLIEYIDPSEGVCWRHRPPANDLLSVVALADSGLEGVRERFGATGYQIRDRFGRVCADYFVGCGSTLSK